MKERSGQGGSEEPRDRLFGVLLFLPVPVVLWLFTRAPLGVPGSIGLGVVVMATHRLYARPWALRRAPRRCLWCGGASGDGPEVEVEEPSGRTAWRACGEGHALLAGHALDTAHRWRLALRLGILGALGLFLPAALLAEAGKLGTATFPDASALFRLAVASTVLPYSVAAGLGARPAAGAGPHAVPFPLHLQALIGTRSVLWLFRVVGAVWLVQGLAHLAGRA